MPSMHRIHVIDTFPGFFFSPEVLGHQQIIGYQIPPFWLILETSMYLLSLSFPNSCFVFLFSGTYKLPTVADTPKRFNVTLLTHKSGRPTSAVYSAKGIGEPPLMLSMAIPIATRYDDEKKVVFPSCGQARLISVSFSPPGSIRRAIASYRADNGCNDWFHLDTPMTSDKIR